GTLELNGVEGRQVEVKANFTVGNTPFGVKIFRDGTITYNPATGKLTADFTGISRLDNDGWSYKGLYTMTLPEKPAAGSEMTMDIFVDGSIVDIFINDKYAQSIRLFAKDSVEENYAVFSNGPVHLNSVKAWELDARVGGAGLSDILDEPEESATGIYDLHGRLVARGGDNVTLDSGIYIRNGKKIIIR
ncbi:MAG: GH32 C-terminal domain-containing protein, partial [Muribaculaceae bacterium]|nr:GH32 C-terminal domain-containing protein [Muribaculaceae bacterium]